jgi:hypothetical protein
MQRWLTRALISGLVGAAGCGNPVEQPVPVKIDAVPAAVLKTAREKLPGYRFTRAYRRVENGRDVFELLARDKQGKMREVEVTPAGEFVDLE